MYRRHGYQRTDIIETVHGDGSRIRSEARGNMLITLRAIKVTKRLNRSKSYISIGTELRMTMGSFFLLLCVIRLVIRIYLSRVYETSRGLSELAATTAKRLFNSE